MGSDTRVTVEHRGWDSIPQDHVARHGFPLPLFYKRQGEQWRAGLDRLSLTVRKLARDRPDSPV